MKVLALMTLNLLLASMAVVDGSVMLQLVVTSENAPDDAASRIDADSQMLLSDFVDRLPGYKSLTPGQSGDTRQRELSEESEEVQQGGDEFVSSMLRGTERQLEISSSLSLSLSISTCPSSCASSGSSYCKSIGCAYCGGSCSRRLQAAVSKAGAKDIEASINDELVQYCNGQPGCSITAKIYKVKKDGSVVPVV